MFAKFLRTPVLWGTSVQLLLGTVSIFDIVKIYHNQINSFELENYNRKDVMIQDVMVKEFIFCHA